MDSADFTAALKARARELGFALVGACRAERPAEYDLFRAWLAEGRAGEMEYLAKHAAAREHPEHLLAGAKSLLMLALPYRTSEPPPSEAGAGRVSRYAWGAADYHDLIHARLRSLCERLRELAPTARARGVVDSAPLLEREFAQRAGLGWRGKNTLLLNKERGSWFFLAAVVTDAELTYDEPHATDHCGVCRACLDACPTQAFPAPYVLDATRCVSYLTIELRGPTPFESREGVGDWLFGCDVCQEVCPWNHKAPPAAEPDLAPLPRNHPRRLAELFSLDDAAFRREFRHAPLWRAKRRGVLRNAAIVLGNQLAAGVGDADADLARPGAAETRFAEALAALALGLRDVEPLVRGACAWALGRIGSPAALAALGERLALETDDATRGEITRALDRAPP